MRKYQNNPFDCAVVRTVNYIGGKWKPIILIRNLESGFLSRLNLDQGPETPEKSQAFSEFLSQKF